MREERNDGLSGMPVNKSPAWLRMNHHIINGRHRRIREGNRRSRILGKHTGYHGI